MPKQHMNLREFAFSKNQKIYKYIKSVLKEDSFPPYIYNNSTSAYLDLDKAYSTTTSILCSRPALTIYLQGIQFLHLTLFSAKITIITDMDVYETLVSLDPNKSTGNDLIGPNILNVEPCPYIAKQKLYSLI